MKKLILNSLLITLLCISACDKVEPPYKNICLDELACNFNGSLPCVYPEAGLDCDSITINNNKTILIEKFTGHKCSNCPAASRKVDELKEFYGNNIISVAIHPGDLIEFTGTDDNYPYDFTTNSSNIISTDMGATFLPLGTVNRVDGGISNRCFIKDEWAEQIDNLLYDSNGDLLTKNLDIEISTSFNEQNKEVTIQTNFTHNNSLEGSHNLCVFIMEDGIISPQIDGTEYIENYEHNHVYRCPVNSVYGEDINKFLLAGVPSSGQLMYSASHLMQFISDYNINWNDEWDNMNQCYVVAYVYNTETLVIEHTQTHHIVNE